MKLYKRIELHNHSIESDGNMSVPQLIDYLFENNISRFALTDHNTTSGYPKLESYIKETNLPMAYLPGFELTSYHGHLLCYNIDRYIPWDDIDIYNADLLFNRVHHHGGIVGIAHPFSVPAPIANGMRFGMQIHDYALLDFIEVINNAHPMIPDNIQGILWWEDLLFKGYHIAATSGMDLHRPSDLSGYFTTYFLEEDATASLQESFTHAISHSKIIVTRGPLITTSLKNSKLHLKISQNTASTLHAVIKTGKRNVTLELENSSHLTTVDFTAQLGENVIIVELYENTIAPNHLLALAPPIYLK